jgi:hypothetical protein
VGGAWGGVYGEGGERAKIRLLRSCI